MQQTPVSKSLNGIKGSCFEVRLEYNSDFIILHLPTIDKLTKEIFVEMKYMLEDWWKFFQTVGYTGVFAAIDPNNVKMSKLLTMLNFEYAGTANEADVYFFKE